MEVKGTTAQKHEPYNISYTKALESSLRQGFLALNQFQHSGFRTKVVSDIEKELSPVKLKRRRIERLSKRCLAESAAIGKRNTAILNERMEKNRLPPIAESKTLRSRSVTIPTAEPKPVPSKSPRFSISSRTVKPLPSSSLITQMYCHSSISQSFSDDDDYDEGGFIPRLKPIFNHNSLNKLPKVPNIPGERPRVLTKPDERL